jgi:hypothetical protein
LYFGGTKVLASSNDVTGFVTRLYEQCMDRQPDNEGLNYWVSMLEEGTISGSNTAERFIYSSEFVGKNLSDDQFLNVMYKTFFDREPDSSGMTYWLNCIEKGATRRFVLARFAESSEFEGICNSYGITKGSVGLYSNVDIYPNITGFVQRFYIRFHGRTPDSAGVNYWVDRLVSSNSSAADLALGFLTSREFIDSNISYENYVTILYRVFMDREPDSAGKLYWIGKLDEGYSRRFLISSFLDSPEFKGVCSNYGISNGIIVTSDEDFRAPIIVTNTIPNPPAIIILPVEEPPNTSKPYSVLFREENIGYMTITLSRSSNWSEYSFESCDLEIFLIDNQILYLKRHDSNMDPLYPCNYYVTVKSRETGQTLFKYIPIYSGA